MRFDPSQLLGFYTKFYGRVFAHRGEHNNMPCFSRYVVRGAVRETFFAGLSGGILQNKTVAGYAAARKMFDKLGMFCASPVILALEGV